MPHAETGVADCIKIEPERQIEPNQKQTGCGGARSSYINRGVSLGWGGGAKL